MSGSNNGKSKAVAPPPSALDRALRLADGGRVSEAESRLRELLRVAPESEPVLLALSTILSKTGRPRQAQELLEPHLASFGESSAFLVALGQAYLQRGQRETATLHLRRAIGAQPSSAEAHFSLGVALQEQGEMLPALRCFEVATSLAPEQGMMHFRLADALWVNRENGRAIGHYQAALALMPRSLEVLLDLARSLRAQGLLEGAIAMCDRALRLDSGCGQALLQLGQCLLEVDRLSAAVDVLRRVLRAEPANVDALLAFSSAAFRCGVVEEVVSSLRAALAVAPSPLLHSNLVFASAFHPGSTDQSLRLEADTWGKLHAPDRHATAQVFDCDRDSERRLRIGYVSPDFCDHCQSLFTLPVLRAHDRSQYEIICFASVGHADSVTAELRQVAAAWHDVGELDDDALAARIRDEGVDVLVDLTMHMAGNRLRTFGLRPAPVQVSWLAYPGTTGLPQMDYRITDRHIDPPPLGHVRAELPAIESLSQYSEQSIVLPDTFWCYDPRSTAPISALPALRNGYVSFGCLNNMAKVNDGVLELWSRVLAAVPSSVIVLRAPCGQPRERALASFRRAGVAGQRVRFVDRAPRAEYLTSYRELDVCLDTFPYNGHTTSLDALWMGVPVVSMRGSTVVGRASVCHAENLNLRELVAGGPDEFVEIAAGLAGDLSALASLRAQLRPRLETSALMDASKFARNLEAGYRLAWRRFCAAAAPRTQ